MSTNPDTFTQLDRATSAVVQGGYDGVGVGIFGNLGAIDIDHCISESGETSAMAKDILATMQCYTEISPSEQGLRLLFTVPSGFQYDKTRYYINNQTIGLEVYIAGCTNKYVTVTGNSLTPELDLEERGTQLQTVLDKYMLKRKDKQMQRVFRSQLSFTPNTQIEDHTLDWDDAELIEKIKQSQRGAAFVALMDGNTRDYKSHSEADIALCNILSFWTGRDAARIDRIFRTSGLMRAKWDERHGSDTYGNLTIQQAIASTTSVYDPEYGRTIAKGREVARNDKVPESGDRKVVEQVGKIDSDLTQDAEAAIRPRTAKRAASFGDSTTRFIWYPYLPRGEYSVMMAAGGTGKTVLCCGIAAAVSKGEKLPGDAAHSAPENVLIISAEDTGEMLKKRLKLSGADLERVFILDATDSIGMDFSTGYAEFCATVKQYKPGLVIIDPWHGFVGEDIDLNRVNALRPVLQKLVHIAKETDCAMLLVSHVNKRSQGENANNAATGSTDFINASRSAFQVIFDGDSEDSRILVHTKSNYAAYGQSVRYKIVEGGVKWDGFSPVTRQTLELAARRRSTPNEVMRQDEARSTVNEELVKALKSETNPFDVVRFTYSDFKKKYGEFIFGSSQPKRALDAVRSRLLDDGYILKTDIQVRISGKKNRGFSIRQDEDFEPEQQEL